MGQLFNSPNTTYNQTMINNIFNIILLHSIPHQHWLVTNSLYSRSRPTRGFRGRALDQVEQVSARLADGGHLSDDGQVVDDEGDLAALLRRQVVGVAQQPEARHVRPCVGLELVHKASRWKGSVAFSLASNIRFIEVLRETLNSVTQSTTM